MFEVKSSTKKKLEFSLFPYVCQPIDVEKVRKKNNLKKKQPILNPVMPGASNNNHLKLDLIFFQ
jgi:hypothetical protein